MYYRHVIHVDIVVRENFIEKAEAYVALMKKFIFVYLIHQLNCTTYLRPKNQKVWNSKQIAGGYNNHFAFTSFGFKYDKDLFKAYKGIHTFKVQRQIYHYVDELIP